MSSFFYSDAIKMIRYRYRYSAMKGIQTSIG